HGADLSGRAGGPPVPTAPLRGTCHRVRRRTRGRRGRRCRRRPLPDRGPGRGLHGVRRPALGLELPAAGVPRCPRRRGPRHRGGSRHGLGDPRASGGGGGPPRAERPPIVSDPIPFPARRKYEMRLYARRHYGLDRYTLIHPHVIVEHVTATSTYRATWNTFASDASDPELHERPGTCS